jgi:hypothetical protein
MLWRGYPPMPESRHLHGAGMLLFACRRFVANELRWGHDCARACWRLDWALTKRTWKGN